MTAVGDGPAKSASQDVSFAVGNVKEGGEVEVRWLQPEVGTELPATLSDPDGLTDAQKAAATWQWYRAKVANPDPNPDLDDIDKPESQWKMIATASGTDIEGDNGVTNIEYTPQGDDAATATKEPTVDENKKLLILVKYNDNAASTAALANMAFGISANPVRADVADGDNNSPDFAASKTTRTISEDAAKGDPVGRTVMVDMDEDNDTLTYELDDNLATSTTTHPPTVTLRTDNADDSDDATFRNATYFFTVDKDTGQIRIKNPLSAEANDGRGYAPNADVLANENIATSTPGEYVVYVRATDPSGEAGGEDSDTIKVTITATNVNEAPKVSGAAQLWVNEADSTDKDFYLGLEYRLHPATGQYLLLEGTTAGTDFADAVAGLDPPVDRANEVVFNISAEGVVRDGEGLHDYGSPRVKGRLVASTTNDNLYTRSEQDLTDTTTWPEPIGGPDGHLFEYSVPSDARGIARRLHFRSAPDFENPMDADRDNVYEVTIGIVDEMGAEGMKSIRVHVGNVDEKGKLELSPDQPHVGGTVMATLTDPDCDPNCDITITDWDWYATTTASSTPDAFDFDADDMVATTSVEINTTDSYMIEEKADEDLIGKFLWVMVEYRDGASVEDDPVTALDERNNDPDGADNMRGNQRTTPPLRPGTTRTRRSLRVPITRYRPIRLLPIRRNSRTTQSVWRYLRPCLPPATSACRYWYTTRSRPITSRTRASTSAVPMEARSSSPRTTTASRIGRTMPLTTWSASMMETG